MKDKTDYQQFVQEWVTDIEAGNPSTVKKGHCFACKLFTQWLDIDENDDDIIFCDGTADGGIDLAHLDRKGADDLADDDTDHSDDQESGTGDTWYLVQSKYGSAFKGTSSLLEESQKLIDTLDGKRSKLNSLALGVKEKLDNFRSKAKEGKDRIILVFATSDPITDDAQKRAIGDIQAMGQKRLGAIFNIQTISIKTIYDSLGNSVNHKLTLKTNLLQPSEGLWVGLTRLTELYDFLKSYKEKTGEVDLLFEKNVRKFLGNRRKVNLKMQKTLKDEDEHSDPQYFGLYNNGITFVVKKVKRKTSRKNANSDHAYELHDPFIVNGCQTTRSIWDVLSSRLNSGGSGECQKEKDWLQKIKKAVVVTKIVEINPKEQELLYAITRHTNSQNTVSDKDLISLEGDFQKWAEEMKTQHGFYLETQRGGWDSEKTNNKNKSVSVWKGNANAFDLIKIFGAGWLAEAGTAFGRNAAFVPGGTIFKRIVDDKEHSFGTDDLWAAYHLMKIAESNGFGRGAKKESRKQTRFLFYSVFISLLRWMLESGGYHSGLRDISNALTLLSREDQKETLEKFIVQTLRIIDAYLDDAQERSIYKEEKYKNDFDSNLNRFLKWEGIGKKHEDCPNLYYQIDISRSLLKMSDSPNKSHYDLIIQVFENDIPKKKSASKK